MKRYFLGPTTDLVPGPPPFPCLDYHYLDLGSIGTAKGAGYCVVVITDDHAAPPGTWIALPDLLDGTTTIASVTQAFALLGDVGPTATSKAYDLAKKLGTFHPMFKP